MFLHFKGRNQLKVSFSCLRRKLLSRCLLKVRTVLSFKLRNSSAKYARVFLLPFSLVNFPIFRRTPTPPPPVLKIFSPFSLRMLISLQNLGGSLKVNNCHHSFPVFNHSYICILGIHDSTISTSTESSGKGSSLLREAKLKQRHVIHVQ